MERGEIKEGEPKARILAVFLLLEQHMHRRTVGELRKGDRDLHGEVQLVRESRGRDTKVAFATDHHTAIRLLDRAMVEGLRDLVLGQVPERGLCREHRGKAGQEQS